jgi:membrane carboxypeptidase/penicillin-binding protein
MVELLKDQPSHQFSPSPELVKLDICPITGQLSCEGCGGKTEFFAPGTEPKIHCKPEYILQLKEDNDKKLEAERDKILQGASTD